MEIQSLKISTLSDGLFLFGYIKPIVLVTGVRVSYLVRITLREVAG